MKNVKYKIKDLVEIGILCSIAVVLDRFIRIPIAVTGGSINISLIPLFVIALRHGPLKTFIAGGVVYGLITCMLDGYGLLTYPLEYLIPFGSIFIISLINKNIFYSFKANKKMTAYLLLLFSILLIGIIRFFSASLDSHLIYGLTMNESYFYNFLYVFMSTIADIIIILLSLPSLINLNERYKTEYFL